MRKRLRTVILTALFLGLVAWSLLVRPAVRTDTGISLSGFQTVRAEDDPVSPGAVTATVTPDPTASPTPSPSPTPDPALALIKECLVLYETEEISVEVVKPQTQVYYCILKKNTDTGGKPADFLPAAENEYGTKYYIDISTLSASRENYVGVCTDLTPRADGLVTVKAITVAATQRKIAFNLDWSYEGSPKSFSGRAAVQSVAVTTNDSKILTYQHLSSAETELIKDIDNSDFKMQWRKGANGDWKPIEEMSYTDWTGMKNSGAILYMRLDAENQTAKSEGCRFSKENKIKFAITKAPAVKIDVSKLTLSMKNGMQFRIHGGDGRWFTILPYSLASTEKKYLRDKTLASLFNPFTESTSGKLSVISIDEVKSVLNYIEPASPTALVLDVRIAATTKKPASQIGTVSIPPQSGKPSVSGITKAEDSYTLGSITMSDNVVASPIFEYVVVLKDDATKKLVDFTTLKWGTVKPGTVFRNNIQSIYNILDEGHTRRTVKITDSGACLLIRRRGVKASSKAEGVLASDVFVLDIPTQ